MFILLNLKKNKKIHTSIDVIVTYFPLTLERTEIYSTNTRTEICSIGIRTEIYFNDIPTEIYLLTI